MAEDGCGLLRCEFLSWTIGGVLDTNNVLKWNRVLGFEFSIQSSVYGATTVAKVSLFSTGNGLL